VRAGDRTVTIARKGAVEGDVHGAVVFVHGRLSGDVHASQRVEIVAGARVEGDVFSPSVVLAPGAQFKGRVNPQHAAQPQAVSVPRSWPPRRDGKRRRPSPAMWSVVGAPAPFGR
jgi:cytoskeletal protein CcmA (bactofilin family)